MSMAPFMEVLTAAISGCHVGYCLPGSRPGPQLVIATSRALLEPASTRLAALPTLPWMCGTLFLVDIEAIDDGTWHMPCIVDATLALPIHSGGEAAETQVYWSTLRFCTRLGMIDGRGVSIR